ncbi:LOW QUALITY PROTEIN: hypothetical protein U0070_017265, partial [Myodes glareolus]
TPFTKSSKRSRGKSGSDLPNIFPEIWPKTPHEAPVRKTISWKIVAHAVEVPAVHTLRRSLRISFIWKTALLSRSLLKIPSKLVVSLVPPPALQGGRAGPQRLGNVPEHQSTLESPSSASTSTPSHRSFFGFEGPEKTFLESHLFVKEKPKKKVPEILQSELDEWAGAVNAEFEAAEQFDLLIE